MNYPIIIGPMRRLLRTIRVEPTNTGFTSKGSDAEGCARHSGVYVRRSPFRLFTGITEFSEIGRPLPFVDFCLQLAICRSRAIMAPNCLAMLIGLSRVGPNQPALTGQSRV